ncbi:MAG: tRNA-dihydrouridine synthase [Candidatus Manganitrophaceae bacterium]
MADLTEPILNFWKQIPKPMIALSPMDGVTDPCFRRIVAIHGKPDLIVTEFTSVEGLLRGAASELGGLIFDEIERPIIAQIYGANPESFFHIAQLVCELGFDGIDINMGCPAKAVSSRGCGAGLINDPPRAKAIMQATREGIEAWRAGASPFIRQSPFDLTSWLAGRKEAGQRARPERHPLPISVKTRLGVDRVVIRKWVEHLLEEKPAAISIHGRTLNQGYRGAADWKAIAEAVSVARGSGTLILGNGDIRSLNEAAQRIRESGVDGVLIGRAALGNPWIFRNKIGFRDLFLEQRPSSLSEEIIPCAEHLRVALEHARLFEQTRGLPRFAEMRKHLGWYCKGFPGASRLREQLVRVRDVKEVETLLIPFLNATEKAPCFSGAATEVPCR